MKDRLISVIVPVLNERENISQVYERVLRVFDSLGPGYDFELVFTDNHSTDGTFDEIIRLAAADTRVRGFRFSRNFGFQRSILEGYRRALGAAAIQLDADLQDPPELIPEFIEHWEAGAAVVYGIRAERPEAKRITLARKAFYRVAALLSEDPLQIDAGDFRLVDRKVLNVLRQLDDAQPYLRGTIASMGFEQTGIPYKRDARHSGESKFSFKQLLALSLDGILNHSVVPLRLASYTGLTVSILMVLSIVAFLVGKFVLGTDWPAGFATTTALLLLGIALNSLFLGVMGEYMGRMYRQLKRGPNTIIERSTEPIDQFGSS